MIRTKRDSLEGFIREQLQGPGACKNKFYCIRNEHEQLVNEEVLNTTPGSVYSTAVLFPQRKQKSEEASQENISRKTIFDSDLDSDSNYQASQEDNSSEILDERVNRLNADEEDLYSLSQRFPTTIGISCCLDKGKENMLPSDIKIIISGRYYSKVPKNHCTDVLIQIDDIVGFSDFFNVYRNSFESVFILTQDGVRLANDISKDISSVKNLLLSINKELCSKIADNPDGNKDMEYQQIGETYRYLKSYKERLFRKLRYLKDSYLSENDKLIIENRIYNIEKNETYLSYLEDAMNICNAKSFGFWRSHSFSKELDLFDIDLNATGNKVIYSPRKNESLNIDFLGNVKDTSFNLRLSVWLQLTSNVIGKSNSKKYLKIQLENTSTPFEEDSEHYFSIVTEKVNERCFFGVEIKIVSNFLCPYQEHRSGDSIQGDLEQLNYLYRSIKDYGVGHLCSVDWKISDTEKWVKSEFIPSFETPDIEPVPRDKNIFIENEGKLIPKQLLEDTRALEFKWLSMFSDASNDEIVLRLYEFIETYHTWILKQGLL